VLKYRKPAVVNDRAVQQINAYQVAGTFGKRKPLADCEIGVLEQLTDIIVDISHLSFTGIEKWGVCFCRHHQIIFSISGIRQNETR